MNSREIRGFRKTLCLTPWEAAEHLLEHKNKESESLWNMIEAGSLPLPQTAAEIIKEVTRKREERLALFKSRLETANIQCGGRLCKEIVNFDLHHSFNAYKADNYKATFWDWKIDYSIGIEFNEKDLATLRNVFFSPPVNISKYLNQKNNRHNE